MTPIPPVPEANRSPYPIAEAPHGAHSNTPSRGSGVNKPTVSIGLIAGLAITALGAIGVAAYVAIVRSSRAAPTPPGPKNSPRRSATSKLKKPTARRSASSISAAKSRKSGGDTAIRGPRDASLIAMGEDYEVAYWTKKFRVNRATLQAAIDAVGNRSTSVAAHLSKA